MSLVTNCYEKVGDRRVTVLLLRSRANLFEINDSFGGAKIS